MLGKAVSLRWRWEDWMEEGGSDDRAWLPLHSLLREKQMGGAPFLPPKSGNESSWNKKVNVTLIQSSWCGGQAPRNSNFRNSEPFQETIPAPGKGDVWERGRRILKLRSGTAQPPPFSPAPSFPSRFPHLASCPQHPLVQPDLALH